MSFAGLCMLPHKSDRRRARSSWERTPATARARREPQCKWGTRATPKWLPPTSSHRQRTASRVAEREQASIRILSRDLRENHPLARWALAAELGCISLMLEFDEANSSNWSHSASLHSHHPRATQNAVGSTLPQPNPQNAVGAAQPHRGARTTWLRSISVGSPSFMRR